MIDISKMPEDKSFDDYPDDEEFELVEHFPRYILEPFEIVFFGDPRYDTALTREQINEIKMNIASKQLEEIARLKVFIEDVYSVVTERHEEAQKEMKEQQDDLFKSGRALAYQEVFEIINTRLNIHEIKINE